jgi:hypothetical protein
MEAFEDIQHQEEAHLLGEIGTLGRRLVELGWTKDQVLDYVKKLFNVSMDPALGDPRANHKED